ncbi:MFS transporter [Streptomyces kurssanovii]|uniref:MFS transporter n=1 Tax=Streptomyces kurssanovii TaxID=67312 RepID=A0ABV3HZE9_9ACTN
MGRLWLLRLVIAFGFAQAAVSMARPAVSYRALSLGADERAIGVIAGVYALLPLFAAVPLGRRTDHGRCTPLLYAGLALIAGGCALSGLAGSLPAMAAWSGVMGLGHLCFVIGAQSIVARRSAPDEQDRNFGHFTIGASLGQLAGPIAAGALIGDDMTRTSALALVVSAAVAAVSLTSMWRIELRHKGAGHTRDAAAVKVPVHRIVRTRGVPAGIFISLAVLSATDILTAYLPVVGEHRGVPPTVVGLLLSLRAAATIACRLVMTPMIRRLGRTTLLTVTCLLGGALCAGIALPVPLWALALMLAALGFCLGVGQPLSMTTVVQAAPAGARSTALALRLTGNRLGQVAAPACAGLVAGLAGAAAPFVMLGVLLVVSGGTAARTGRSGREPVATGGPGGADGPSREPGGTGPVVTGGADGGPPGGADGGPSREPGGTGPTAAGADGPRGGAPGGAAQGADAAESPGRHSRGVR